ncbi:MAG: hypothetical protein Q7T68_15670 [Sphingopyxis sp.]|nr:hypothetical protein [Sphingopyxis sp.]
MPIASAALASPPAVDPADAKRFGTLATLIGTTWAIGKQEVISITWDRPGFGILINRRGLYGHTETIVVPSTDGRNLRYVTRNMTFNDVREALIPVPGKGRFLVHATPGEREECRQAKSGTACTVLTATGKQWKADKSVIPVSAQSFNLAPVSAGQAAAVLAEAAKLGEFPDRPEKTYHPTLGILANIANKIWTNDYSFWPYAPFFEIWESGGTTSMVAKSPWGQTVHFKGGISIAMTGSFHSGSGFGDVYARTPVTVRVQEGGAAVFCTSGGKGVEDFCYRYRTDTTGKKLLAEPYGIPDQPRFVLNEFELSKDMRKSPLAAVAFKSFRSSDRSIHFFSADRFTFHSERMTREFRTSAAADNGILEKYRISPDGSVVWLSNGEKLVPSLRADILLAKQAKEDEGRIQTSLRVKEINRREREAFWSGFERDMAQMSVAVQSGAFNSNTWNATPFNFGMGSNTGAAVGDMGGIMHSSAPQMTPAQRVQYEELQAYKLREQIYGSSGSSAAGTQSAMTGRQAGNDSQPAEAKQPEIRWFSCVTTRWGRLPDNSTGILSHSYGVVSSTLSTDATSNRFRQKTQAGGIDGENGGGGCFPEASRFDARERVSAAVARNKKGPPHIQHYTGNDFGFN